MREISLDRTASFTAGPCLFATTWPAGIGEHTACGRRKFKSRANTTLIDRGREAVDSGTRRAWHETVRQHDEPGSGYSWIVYTAAVIVIGGLAGYIIALPTGQPAGVASAAIVATGAAPLQSPAQAPILDENELRAYRDILGRDPGNVQAAVQAGNLLYDAQRYGEAVPFYQQAFAIEPSDVNVSTDLGTALWYAGRADEALAQYARSLALNPRHAHTLYNLGIVRADGKHDYAGAVEAWDALLKTSPDYPEAARVRARIADAHQKLSR